MTTEQLRCGELVKRICDIFAASANQNLQKMGLTLSQMKMLFHLDYVPGGSFTLKELEKRLGSSQATVAGLAARLEKKGLVESYIDADDRRIKHIRLLPAGRAVCQGAKASIEAEEKWLLEPLDPGEQRQLQNLLQKVYAHIR